MSDEKPFAEKRTGGCIVVAGRYLCGYHQDEDCAALNSAVAARERKAAAKALMDFAVSLVSDYPAASFVADGMKPIPSTVAVQVVVAKLRSRAAALEGGAT